MKVQPMPLFATDLRSGDTSESAKTQLLVKSTSEQEIKTEKEMATNISNKARQQAAVEQARTIAVASAVQSQQFPSNAVKTSIYTLYNFVPKNFFKQFTRFSNVYFLFITALQLIPEVTSTPGFPTMIVPLVFIIVVSAVRDLIEDLDRHQSDNLQNRARVAKLSSGGSSETRLFADGICSDLGVGDLVRVCQNEEIPADLVLLATSRGQGQCFVMTANLDGESTLKPRYVLPELCTPPYGRDCFTAEGELTSEGAARIKQITVECEPPNRRIDRFEGSIKLPAVVVALAALGIEGGSQDDGGWDLDITNVLLKGTQLKDTPWVIGVVVYTGDDTRVRQNSSETPIKQSWLYRFINKITLWVVLAQIVILTVAVAVQKRLMSSTSVIANPYIDEDVKNSDTLDLVYLFLAYMLLFSNFVPISLQVTIDLTRYFQAIVIQRDPEMHMPEPPSLTGSRRRLSGVLGMQAAHNKRHFVRVQSSELNEELGLIEHIFTDKTGTLTCNRMEFRSCHVDGETFNFDDKQGCLHAVATAQDGLVSFNDSSSSTVSSPVRKMISSLINLPSSDDVVQQDPARWGQEKLLSPQMKKFLLNLAVNNSISPSSRDAQITSASLSRTEYSGPSPDEKALVGAAARLGIQLTYRDNAHVTVSIDKQEIDLQILQLFEFTSDRKKSSIVCRHPDGKIVLYCKGADSVILQALSANNPSTKVHQVKEQMKVYSANGLRVLCVAERVLSEDDYTSWNARYVTLRAAKKKTSQGRNNTREEDDVHRASGALSELVSELECQLMLVGISGIEDKIQEGTPETLEKFREAGVKVWMLTGDRPDTATNVAYAVRLISSDMTLISLTERQWLESKTSALQFFKRELKQMEGGDSPLHTSSFMTATANSERLGGNGGSIRAVHHQSVTGGGRRYAMILNDTAVEAIKQFGLEDEFLELCMHCESVLCARISPKQKEFIVQMVRTKYPDKVTMAVGDGANDVPMIQCAHIGVGIAGEEGNQASDASDYSIPAFRFLQKLVLVHGRWMNRRIAVLTLYIFYKNVLLVLPQFVYGIYCLFSGQSSYYDPLLQLFNICFTSLPVMYFSVFDQDISATTTLLYPRLYQDGSSHAFLNARVFLYWMVEATVASILIVLVPAKLIPLVSWSSTGKDNDLWSLGLTQNFIVVFLANVRLLLEVSTSHFKMLTLTTASVLFWWVIVYGASTFGREFYGILRVGSLAHLALCCAICSTLSLSVAFIPRAIDVLMAPKPRTICRELDYLTGAKDRDYLTRRKLSVAKGDPDGRAVVVPT